MLRGARWRPHLTERRVRVDGSNRMITAEEFAREQGPGLNPFEFVEVLRKTFLVDTYDRLHELQEVRAQASAPPRSWREGEDLNGRSS